MLPFYSILKDNTILVVTKSNIIFLFLGLHSPVPRGSSKRNRKQQKHKEGLMMGAGGSDPDMDHWSRHEKYDGDIFLDISYRKHLSRHANK